MVGFLLGFPIDLPTKHHEYAAPHCQNTQIGPLKDVFNHWHFVNKKTEPACQEHLRWTTRAFNSFHSIPCRSILIHSLANQSSTNQGLVNYNSSENELCPDQVLQRLDY